VKITAAPAAARPGGRLIQRIRDEVLSSRTVDRLKRELEDELEAVSSSERAAEDDTRRDALERAVRRIWGAPL
jgi:hypothetical protein